MNTVYFNNLNIFERSFIFASNFISTKPLIFNNKLNALKFIFEKVKFFSVNFAEGKKN